VSSPLEDIENRKAQQDIGAFGFRVYEGARTDGASFFEAFIVTVAFFRGLMGMSEDGQKGGSA
jgi:hypothetical protein